MKSNASTGTWRRPIYHKRVIPEIPMYVSPCTSTRDCGTDSRAEETRSSNSSCCSWTFLFGSYQEACYCREAAVVATASRIQLYTHNDKPSGKSGSLSGSYRILHPMLVVTDCVWVFSVESKQHIKYKSAILISGCSDRIVYTGAFAHVATYYRCTAAVVRT